MSYPVFKVGQRVIHNSTVYQVGTVIATYQDSRAAWYWVKVEYDNGAVAKRPEYEFRSSVTTPPEWPARHFATWNREEDIRLLNAVRRRISKDGVLMLMQRTEESLRMRLGMHAGFAPYDDYFVCLTSAMKWIQAQPRGFTSRAIERKWGYPENHGHTVVTIPKEWIRYGKDILETTINLRPINLDKEPIPVPTEKFYAVLRNPVGYTKEQAIAEAENYVRNNPKGAVAYIMESVESVSLVQPAVQRTALKAKPKRKRK